jgi:hypothetical protein
MVRLFLDDLRIPTDCPKTHYMVYRCVDLIIYHEEWDIVRSHGQFVKWIKENGLPDLISFDNDLGDDRALNYVTEYLKDPQGTEEKWWKKELFK